jgi:hypothetical protein
MLLPLLALLTVGNYAATPQGAAIGALYFKSQKSAAVVRVNRSGTYAAVLVAGGRLEGSLVDAPILVRHFSFGWQALDLLNFRCRLDSHALEPQDETALLRGMPKPADDRPCRGLKDMGPTAEIEAVRQLMRGPLVPYVVVSGTWAVGEWYGGGGGESLYQKRNGHWILIESSGGAMGVSNVRIYGVPQSDWCKFGIYGATCH